jgi:predicted nucleic acid-binding protein
LERPRNSAVTSAITMTELLVQPYRAENQALVERYFGLLSSFPQLEWVAPDLAIADAAAGLRATYRLRTPDALQIATALQRSATAFLTNDRELLRVQELEIGLFDQFLSGY